MNITRTPPILREVDGRWYVVLIMDGMGEIAAPVGSWFATQFFAKVVLPTLVLDAQANDHA